MGLFNIKPKQTTKKLLSPLKDRAKDVITGRFGLGEDLEQHTLEAIGKKYGITRERVRQIENASLSQIRKSDAFKVETELFAELEKLINSLGSVVKEDELLNTLSNDSETKNHIHFYLVLGDQFTKSKEDDQFHSRWSTHQPTLDRIHDALQGLYSSLKDDELVPEGEIVERFLDAVKDISREHRNEEVIRRWLNISKKIQKNPLNEYGKSESKNVKVRGIKDYAYLVLRKHGSPMHFKEVSEEITRMFGKKSHPATAHNELIKDKRFVLVGRGKYALREWGYKEGIVKDVISEILKKYGPLDKETLVDYVLRERFLKKNTVLVNLHNQKNFKRLPDGKYTVAK